MKMKEIIKFQDDRDKQQTDVGSKKYRDNESVISCPGETAGRLAGPFTFLTSLTFILILIWEGNDSNCTAPVYNRHTASMIINVSLT